MLREHSAIFEDSLKVVDMLVILVSYYITLVIYDHKGAIGEHSPYFYVGLLVVALPLWRVLISISAGGLSRRTVSFRQEAWALVKVHLVGISVLLVSLFTYSPRLLQNRFVIYFVFLNLLLLLAERVMLRLFLNSIRIMGFNYRNHLLVGWNPWAKAYAQRIKNNPQLGYRVVGYLADFEGKDTELPYLGTVDRLEHEVKSRVVDQVVITLRLSDKRAEGCIDLMEQMGKNTALILDDLSEKLVTGRAINFQGLAMLNYSTAPRHLPQLALKRCLDILGSLVGLILLSPALLVTALAIKVSSPGPVLFKQPRVGLNGRVFNCYKFRSMVVNAEDVKAAISHLNEMSGPVFKIKNDPRVTPVGRLIRKTSIDELPQLFNVLLGHMSLVGPRPPLPSEVNLYENSHRKRLSVKPGITCIWQVSGRNNVDFDHWMEMDAEYVHNWSLWLDLKILFRTIPAVLMRKGAS